MNTELILTQAFEESRYHRNFHHVIYTLFMTLYIAFLGFQISAPDQIEAIRGQVGVSIGVGAIVFLLIPAYICYLIVTYHKTIVHLNAIIAFTAVLPDDIASSVAKNPTLARAFDVMLFKKYQKAIDGRSPMLIGRGQWFFLVTFIMLVVCDLLVFLLMHAPSQV
jgi:hypothetical protein